MGSLEMPLLPIEKVETIEKSFPIPLYRKPSGLQINLKNRALSYHPLN